MASTFTNLLFHVVFSTKNRAAAIHEGLREPLYEYMGGIIRGEGGVLLQIGGVPDHVHLLTKIKADTALSAIVGRIKAGSSRWLNEKKREADHFEWQTGYGAFSVSESQVSKVRKYIQTQEAHHAKVSFKDELIALLKKQGSNMTSAICSVDVIPNDELPSPFRGFGVCVGCVTWGWQKRQPQATCLCPFGACSVL
jgi:REP element-mobilizing transposase RayT